MKENKLTHVWLSLLTADLLIAGFGKEEQIWHPYHEYLGKI